MRFALLGNHPDGLQMAQALVATGRHELVAYFGSGFQWEKAGLKAVRTFGDMEEILADPTIDAIIVAGDSGQRPLQLRRALQSERHVLCVFPPDQSPDITYEAAMIQADTRRVLLPILPGVPVEQCAVERLGDWLHEGRFANMELYEAKRRRVRELLAPLFASETNGPVDQVTRDAAAHESQRIVNRISGED